MYPTRLSRPRRSLSAAAIILLLAAVAACAPGTSGTPAAADVATPRPIATTIVRLAPTALVTSMPSATPIPPTHAPPNATAAPSTPTGGLVAPTTVAATPVGAPPTATGPAARLTYLWPMHRPAGFIVDPTRSRANDGSFVLHLAPPEGGQFSATILGGREALVGFNGAGRPVTVRGRPGRELNTGAGAAVYWEEDGQPHGVRTALSLEEALRIAESLEVVGLPAWRERVARPDPGNLAVGLDEGRIVVVGQGFGAGERVSVHVVAAATEPQTFAVTADPDGRFLFRPGILVMPGTTAQVESRAANGKAHTATLVGPAAGG